MKTPEQQLNDKWNIKKVIDEAIKNFHTNPSPDTLVKLKELQTNYKNTQQVIEEFKKNNKEEHKELKVSVSNIENRIIGIEKGIISIPERLADKFDKRYAKKLSEKVVYAMVGIILTGVLLGLLSLIFK